MNIAHLGTFDVANYGDLLLPLILQWRLGEADRRFIHVSPVGGPPVWSDCVRTLPLQPSLDRPPAIDAVVTGGGNIVHASPARLPHYRCDRLTSLTAYPGLWLGAAHLAARLSAPVCWNAPGVPQQFSDDAASLIEWTTSVAQYLSVRDERSRELLIKAGCGQPVAVVPDTAIEVARLWSSGEIDTAYARAFTDRGRRAPDRTLAVHVNQRYIDEDVETIAGRIDHICQVWNATPILIALGPCHGDDRLARRIARRMQTAPLLIDAPGSLREVAACIGRSQAYFGSSLHGMITACSFGKPGLLVAREQGDGGRKFSGFLEQFKLSRCLASSWDEAEGTAGALLDAPREPWRSVLPSAVDRLDRHWSQIEEALSQRNVSSGATAGWSSSVKRATGGTAGQASSGTQQTRVEEQSAPTPLERFDQLCARRFAGGGVFQGVLHEQASRAVDALEAADRANRKLAELRDAHQRMNAEFRAELCSRKAAAERQQQQLSAELAAERDARQSVQQDAAALTGWLEDVESGIAALLASRRWRAGDLLGNLWARISGKPRVAMATDLFADVFASFRRCRLDDHVGDVPVSVDPLPSVDHVTADVIVCVHNAMDYAVACLQSVIEQTNCRHRLIIVDDGSSKECRQALVEIAGRRPGSMVIRNDRALGYTKSANIGLRRSSADYAVLLNSDAVVTPQWLERIIACGQSDPRIGLVGPLSNAASWQSVPDQLAADGDWAVNSLPPGCMPTDVARAVADASSRRFPRVTLLNGFALAIRSDVIHSIGLLDETNFPHGYGEENDYCLRAAAAGFHLAVADHAYVYHAKSRSYSHRRRRRLTRRGQRALRRNHGDAIINAALRSVRHNPDLSAARHAAARAIEFLDGRSSGATAGLSSSASSNELQVPIRTPVDSPSILFLLPVQGGGGGAHSVVQEARGMAELGVDVQIAVDARYRDNFRDNYPEIARDSRLFFYYALPDDLTAEAGRFDVVVATVYFSVRLLKSIVAVHPQVLPAYYVQDYEPRFFTRFSRHWRQARQSYELVPGMVHFAKTQWICDTVAARHGVHVAKVAPSLDHDVFYPSLSENRRNGPIRLAAMIRPATPYRGADRTMQVLSRLKSRFAERIELHTFGCGDDDVAASELERDFAFTNHGVLRRRQVADLLRDSAVFLDFSDYQAFGRTGLEAMACRCAVVLPQEGGAHEYAIDRQNALLVDTRDMESCFRAAGELIADDGLRVRLQEAAVKKAAEYSIRRAAVSELSLLTRARKERTEISAPEVSPAVHQQTADRESDRLHVRAIVPRMAGGELAGSTYVRLLLPLEHPSNRGRVRVEIRTWDRSYEQSADIVIIQRNAVARLDDARRLVESCQRAGTPLVYEIDDNLLALPDTHPEAADYRRQSPSMRYLIENAALVTVPTYDLAQYVRLFNDRVRVIPNALDESLWFDEPDAPAARQSPTWPVRILAMGTRTHEDDLEIVVDAARRLRREYGRRVRFEVIGCVPRGRRADWYRTIRVPANCRTYPDFVRWLRRTNRWQIGIAPLAPSAFNDAKSGLKYLDYAALRLAGVFSDAPAYRNVVRQLETGMLVAGGNDWYEVLKLLIDNPPLRAELAQAAHQHVAREHTLRRRARLWVDAFGDVLSHTSAGTPVGSRLS